MQKTTIGVFLLALAVYVGCAAKYRTLHGKKGAATDGSEEFVSQSEDSVAQQTFTISADPENVGIGEEVTFTGVCGQGDTAIIVWDFADGSHEESGMTVIHSYQETGSFEVSAQCLESGRTPQDATVTITVTTTSPNQTDGGGNGDSSDTDSGDTDSGNSDNGSDGNNDGGDSVTDGSDGSYDGSDSSNDGGGYDDGYDGYDDGGDDYKDDGGKSDDGGYPGQNPNQSPGQSPSQSPTK